MRCWIESVATASLLLVLVSPQRTAAQSVTAWSYTRKITMDSANGHTPVAFTTRIQVTDRFIRNQILEFGGTNIAADPLKGSYSLFDGTDSTMTSVLPSQHMATVATVGTSFGAVRSRRVSYRPDFKRTLDDLGAGEPLIGHSTEHYRLTESGGMDVTMLGRTCTRRINTVADYWIARDVDIHSALEASLKVYGLADALPRMVVPQTGAQFSMPKGTPLRTISRTTSTDSTGAEHVVTSTMEYLEISHGAVDDSVFAVPAGYGTLDLGNAAPRSATTDSVMAAAARKGLDTFCGNPG
jgi:hypothetical protein